MLIAPREIEGVIQRYAWGDPEYIPTMVGATPDGRPWAELWLGTHPSGPAHFLDGTELRSVTGDLPYLLKVLAAAEPLSLQVHPSAAQAADGFARGIYPDGHAKPELLCALTEFEAFCGLRPVDATLDLLGRLGVEDLAQSIVDDGLETAMSALYRGQIDPGPVVSACRSSRLPEAMWVSRLDERYPGDASVAVTLLLNYVVLAPGEAIHLTAGNLHAYLHGAGIELMGASDNVIRGGLTLKDVDLDELLRIVDATPLAEPVMHATAGVYPLPEAGCTLIRLDPGDVHVSTGHELSIGLDGHAYYLPPGATLSPTAPTFVVVVDS